MKTKSLHLISLPSLALFLSACGGGGSSNSNNEQSNITPIPITPNPVVVAQPRPVEEVNWQSARLLQTNNALENTVEITGNQLSINVTSSEVSNSAHLQIYINSDNKAETGFQFDNQAWAESGVDFLIEDGDLFKSTANNSGWNWNINAGAIDYTIDNHIASAKIDLSLLGGICNTLKIGVMARDEFWDISTFSPASSQMQTYNISYCNTDEVDTVAPQISLLGANPLNITRGSSFIDPSATAFDNVDGDITERVLIKSSTINTSVAGTYEITYTVSDLSGNTSTASRTVIVNNVPVIQGITVDGDSSDWDNIPTLSSTNNGVLKVTDDEEKLYILVTSNNLGENTQILLDTDNNASTGLLLSEQVAAWTGGADYMLENNSLDKSTSNTGWSWDFDIAPIEYIRTNGTLEIAIKKSDFNSLSNRLPIGYVSRTVDWNANYILPEDALPVYTMQFANEVNPVTANNDSVTTENDTSLIIDALANDSSTIAGSLSLRIVSQPSSGSVIISQNEFVYTPDSTFTGTVDFEYIASDTNGNTDNANVRIIVTAPVITNSAPVANNDLASTNQDQFVNIAVLSNDTDVDGDTLSLGSFSNPDNGSTVRVGNSIRYTPNTGFTGSDTFTYNISDGNGGTNSANVTVTVSSLPNVAPVANNDLASTNQDQFVNIAVLSNDTDADGDTLTIGIISNPNNGSAVRTGNSIRYTPNTGFTGSDTFTYNISDGNGGTNSANVTVTVSSLPNVAPVANNDSATTDGIRTREINVLANDTDEDNDTLRITGFTPPNNGTVIILSAGSSLSYTPNASFSGTETFNYTITDDNGGIDNATVTVTVPTNNAPDAVEDVASVFFNETVTVNVLANDTDPDGDTLSIVPGSVSVFTLGFARLNTNGTIFFDPQGNVASLSVFYTVTDGRGGTDSAVLTISSTDPDDDNESFPDTTNDFVTTPVNTAVFIDVLGNDTDADGDTLLLGMVDQGQNGTTQAVTRNGVVGVLYTPNPGFTGLDTFFYGVEDGRGKNGSGIVEITVQ